MKHRLSKPFPDYGYRLDISDPMIKALYDRYKRKQGIPRVVPAFRPGTAQLRAGGYQSDEEERGAGK